MSYLSLEGLIHDRQGVCPTNEVDVGDAEHTSQFFCRHFHGSRRRRRSRRRLRKRSRHRRMERYVALHLLHYLMNMSVENTDRAEFLEIGERLGAVVGA